MTHAEIIGEFLGSVNRGEIDEGFTHVAEDGVADWSQSRGPWSGLYKGREAIKQIWRENFVEPWEFRRIELEKVQNLGDGLLVSQTLITARGAGSGVEVTARGGQLWRFEGEVVNWQLFQSFDEALAAAESAE